MLGAAVVAFLEVGRRGCWRRRVGERTEGDDAGHWMPEGLVMGMGGGKRKTQEYEPLVGDGTMGVLLKIPGRMRETWMMRRRMMVTERQK